MRFYFTGPRLFWGLVRPGVSLSGTELKRLLSPRVSVPLVSVHVSGGVPAPRVVPPTVPVPPQHVVQQHHAGSVRLPLRQHSIVGRVVTWHSSD
jgi:hypothetical protein